MTVEVFAAFKRWKVVVVFACAGLAIALPPVTQLLFAAAGIFTFVVCPPTVLLFFGPRWGLSWDFFALAGPLNGGLYAAFGVLLHRLSKSV